MCNISLQRCLFGKIKTRMWLSERLASGQPWFSRMCSAASDRLQLNSPHPFNFSCQNLPDACDVTHWGPSAGAIGSSLEWLKGNSLVDRSATRFVLKLCFIKSMLFEFRLYGLEWLWKGLWGMMGDYGPLIPGPLFQEEPT